MLKVLKFGGSSMADAAQFAKIKAIVESDDSRRVVVVSAPGKRFKDDHKVTDLLYLCHAHVQYGVSCENIFQMIRERYEGIAKDCGLDIDLSADFDKLWRKLCDGVDKDYVASRGEYFAAKLMAAYLGWTFLDAALWLKFNLDGSVDQEATYAALRQAAEGQKVVIPGFYGVMPDGHIKTFSRGGSDITGALAAAALSMSVGATLDAIKAGLANLKAVPGRLFPIQLAENQLLLDDSYNANVGSMTAAVQVLAEMPGYRVLVVGDMAELGAESEACHVQVGEAAKAAGIDRVLSVGKQSHAISTASGVGEHFADKTALITRLKSLIAEQQVITILVKGSRSAAMEEVVRALQENGTC